MPNPRKKPFIFHASKTLWKVFKNVLKAVGKLIKAFFKVVGDLFDGLGD